MLFLWWQQTHAPKGPRRDNVKFIHSPARQKKCESSKKRKESFPLLWLFQRKPPTPAWLLLQTTALLIWLLLNRNCFFAGSTPASDSGFARAVCNPPRALTFSLDFVEDEGSRDLAVKKLVLWFNIPTPWSSEALCCRGGFKLGKSD